MKVNEVGRRSLCLALLLLAAPAAAQETGLERAVQLTERGRFGEAIPLLTTVTLSPAEPAARRARAWAYLGACQILTGQAALGRESLRQAFVLDPGLSLPPNAPAAVVEVAAAARIEARAALGALLDRAAAQSEDALGAPAGPPPALLAPPPVATLALPPAAPTGQRNHFILGVEMSGIGFIGTSEAAPTPEVLVGGGDDTGRFLLLFGPMLGPHVGYSTRFRYEGGTRAAPVGYNLGIDFGVVAVPSSAISPYLDGSLCPVGITWQVGRFLFEARVVSVGYYLSLADHGPSAFSLEGGVEASWLP